MKAEQQLIFNEIELPNAPNISAWITVSIIVLLALVALFFAYRYYQKNRRLIASYLRYQWLLYRGLQKIESTREKAEKIYQLLCSHFNRNHLPDSHQLPKLFKSQTEAWLHFKDKLNQARFSEQNCSEETLEELMRQCRHWIKKPE